MKLPWATWTREQWWYFGIFAVLLLAWPGIVYLRGGPNLPSVIYWLTALVVLAYTVETYGMRQEMFKARLRLETPEVLLHLDPTLDPTAYSGFFDVIVENSSQEPAFDVIFTEVPDLPVTGSRSTRDIGFLRHGIRHLAPGQKYRAFS